MITERPHTAITTNRAPWPLHALVVVVYVVCVKVRLCDFAELSRNKPLQLLKPTFSKVEEFGESFTEFGHLQSLTCARCTCVEEVLSVPHSSLIQGMGWSVGRRWNAPRIIVLLLGSAIAIFGFSLLLPSKSQGLAATDRRRLRGGAPQAHMPEDVSERRVGQLDKAVRKYKGETVGELHAGAACEQQNVQTLQPGYGAPEGIKGGENYLAICLSIKDLHRDVREWVAHHKAVRGQTDAHKLGNCYAASPCTDMHLFDRADWRWKGVPL